MNSFENTVARFRKTAEMVEELKEYANALSAERDALQAEIVEHCAANPDAFNVFQRKTSSAGIVGRNLFTVSFSEQLARRNCKRLDDQEWLKNIWVDVENLGDAAYVQQSYKLMASKVNADYKAGKMSDAQFKRIGLRYERVAKVKAVRVPNDAEVAALTKAAEVLVDKIEG